MDQKFWILKRSLEMSKFLFWKVKRFKTINSKLQMTFKSHSQYRSINGGTDPTKNKPNSSRSHHLPEKDHKI